MTRAKKLVAAALCLAFVSFARPAAATYDYGSFQTGYIQDIYVQTSGVCPGCTGYKTVYVVQLMQDSTTVQTGNKSPCQALGKFATTEASMLGLFMSARLAKQKVRVWGTLEQRDGSGACPGALAGDADNIAMFEIAKN